MLYLFDYNKKMIILTKKFLQKLITVMYIHMNKLTKLSALKSGSCEKKLNIPDLVQAFCFGNSRFNLIYRLLYLPIV